MSTKIEQRISSSLTAMRSTLSNADLTEGRKSAREWTSKTPASMPAYLHLASTLLRDKPVTAAFPPISNHRCLASGAAAHSGLFRAARYLARAARSAESVFAALPDGLRAYLEKAATLVALAAIEVDFEAALLRGERSRARTLLELAMRNCPQGPRQTTWEHCRSVAQHYLILSRRLRNLEFAEREHPTWSQHLPKWFHTWRTQLAEATRNNVGLAQGYLEWHDCGKPFCLEYDADGRAHFPQHAKVSARLWERLGGSAAASHLIARDMDLHTLAPSAMAEFAKQENAALLLIATLAAVNANAQLFGGLESDSFKIKAKQLEARGKRLCDALFGNANIKVGA